MLNTLHTPLWRRVLSLPQTLLGWFAVGLAGIFWALTVYFAVYPAGLVVLVWLLASAASGVVALIALLRSHERSALVWLAMVAGLPAIPPWALSLSSSWTGWVSAPPYW